MSEIVRNDSDSKVRSAALESIGRLGSEAAAETLAGLYDSIPELELKKKALASMRYSRKLTPKVRARLIEIAKTSPHDDLLRAALRVGGLAAGADSGRLAALSSYGDAVGFAFQIVDDLLDVTGTAEELGKAVGKDVARGKLTYPGVIGREAAELRARELADEAVACMECFGDRARLLVGIARHVVERRS